MRALLPVALLLSTACASTRSGGVSDAPAPAAPPARAEPAAASAEPAESRPGMTPEELFEVHCSACHSLEIPTAQRLDRSGWEWVMEDMVEEYGVTWLSEEEQRILVDYLVEHYGPARPR